MSGISSLTLVMADLLYYSYSSVDGHLAVLLISMSLTINHVQQSHELMGHLCLLMEDFIQKFSHFRRRYLYFYIFPYNVGNIYIIFVNIL